MLYLFIHNLLYYMKFGRVSATPYCNYSLLCVLSLDVYFSTTWNLVDYKLLFLVTILCCILTIRYYISCNIYEVLLMKLSIVECNYGYCKKIGWLYQLLLSLKYFLWDITYKIECCWVLAVYNVKTRFSVKEFTSRIVHLLLTNLCILEYQLLLLYKVFPTLAVTLSIKCLFQY